MVVAGALCLPLTYHASREGEWILALVPIALISGLGQSVASKVGRLPLLVSVACFCLGAVATEVAFYLMWYVEYGYLDQEPSVSQAVAIVEFGFIAGVGTATIVSVGPLTRGIATRWSENGTAQSTGWGKPVSPFIRVLAWLVFICGIVALASIAAEELWGLRRTHNMSTLDFVLVSFITAHCARIAITGKAANGLLPWK
jgi:hypothetical protein